MDQSTRISDLPDLNNLKMDVYPTQGNQPMDKGQRGSNMFENPNSQYVPMNVHPNPYGNTPPQNNIMPPPQYTPKQANQMLPNTVETNTPQYPLPSRDIPMDTTQYTQDEKMKPNYIPKEEREDYIPILKKESRDKKQKHRVRFAEDLFVDLQKPVIYMMIFFLLQLPIIQRLIFKNLSFLPLYHEDGNMNIWGYLFKTLVFGLFLYGYEYVGHIL